MVGRAGARPDYRRAIDRLLDFFRAHQGVEVPLTRILDLRIAQYNRAIKELRAQGHVIENRTEWRGMVKHSWYVYRGKP